MEELHRKIDIVVERIYRELVLLRHTIHANPELSHQEYETAKLVERVLTEWKIDYQRLPNSTAIVAKIQGNLTGDGSIGLRADMDALPIEEDTTLAYASKNSGVMHACGHDIHTVNLLGTGYVLSQLKDHFAGTVKLVFQPAEEIGGGAQELLDFGVLENPKVSAFLAAHVSEDLKVGQVRVKAEEVMLAASQFTITLNGRGGHASAPHRTDDIVLAAAKFIVELQSIPSRKLNHIEPAVITVSSIHGGTRGNIIPQEVVLIGTIRTQNNELRQEIHEQIKNILKAHEMITGVAGKAEFRFGSGAVYNDPALTRKFIAIARQVIGDENVLIAKLPNNGSENFYRFAKEVPSVFFRIGITEGSLDNVEAAHSPQFKASDESLKTGVRVMTAAAIAFLQTEGTSI